MLDVGDFAGGRRVGDIGGGVEEFTFQAGVAVDVGSDFHVFRESDVFPAHDGNDYARTGVSAFGFAAGAQDGLIIVGEADAANENAEFAAAAEGFLGLGFVDDAGGVGAFGNDEEAVDDDVFGDFEIHFVADLGGGGREFSAIESDHGAVEIDVVSGTGALDLADLLGFAMSR